MKVGAVVILVVAMLVLYIAIAGEVSLTSIAMGLIASLVAAIALSDFVVEKSAKLIDIRRWGRAIKYFFHYMLSIEPRAHLDVMKRILSPSMPVNPGIVAVPYDVETEYAILMIANSITNTPGTVVVDIDKEKKILFVHWIDMKAIEPEECRRWISRVFEEYARKVFD